MKKGFTLVELLAVIIILAIIAMITTISVGTIIKDSKTNLSQMQKSKIEEATRAFYIKEGMNNGATCVNVSDLIQKGYIEKDVVKDPATSKEMTGSVKISYNSNKYSYTYQDIPCVKINDYNEFVYEGLDCENVSFLSGDINEDGVPNNRDLVLLQQYIAGQIDFDKKALCAADVNEDKIIGSLDLQLLQGFINKHDGIELPYKEDIGEYRIIKYNLNGGYAVNIERYFPEFGIVYELKAPEKEGYAFMGWTGSNGETPETEVTIEITACKEGEECTASDLEYTAHWEKSES